VNGVATGSSDAVPVVIDSNGQLGTINSSQRFKEDIQDMGESSRGLMRLHPVTFRYRKAFDDGSKPLQYGLIAEQVAEVYPDLVVHSADGQVQTVKYQVLDSMLLNEVQRQQAEIQLLQARLAKMEAALASMSRTGNEQQVSTITPQ
ncbi:MAG TPA: tail fiber domain-containing protein, partial [Bryobacteraceae bacterium]|nr:tail fiber domain-containing protein [Bryobacteraceae bacterium]